MTTDDPAYSPGIGPLGSPDCSIAEDIASAVDEARQLMTDLGFRPYRVFSVRARWTGGEKGRGSRRLVEREILPTPKVGGVASVNRELRSGGVVERGTVRLSEISARYDESDIRSLFFTAEGDEVWIEIRHDSRDGDAPARRYTIAAVPERNGEKFEWSVTLRRSDGAPARGA